MRLLMSVYNIHYLDLRKNNNSTHEIRLYIIMHEINYAAKLLCKVDIYSYLTESREFILFDKHSDRLFRFVCSMLSDSLSSSRERLSEEICNRGKY